MALPRSFNELGFILSLLLVIVNPVYGFHRQYRHLWAHMPNSILGSGMTVIPREELGTLEHP